MTDIVERLRALHQSGMAGAAHAAVLEAADEIERLYALNEGGKYLCCERKELELFVALKERDDARAEIERLRAKLAEYENVPVRLRHIMKTGKMPPDGQVKAEEDNRE